MELRSVGSVGLPPPRGQRDAPVEETAPEPEERFSSGLGTPPERPPAGGPQVFSKSALLGVASLTMVAVAGALVPGVIMGAPEAESSTPSEPSGPQHKVTPTTTTVTVKQPPLEPSLAEWNLAGAPPGQVAGPSGLAPTPDPGPPERAPVLAPTQDAKAAVSAPTPASGLPEKAPAPAPRLDPTPAPQLDPTPTPGPQPDHAAAPQLDPTPAPSPRLEPIPDQGPSDAPSRQTAGPPPRTEIEPAAPPRLNPTKPKKLELPAAQKGDYVKHRINFSHLIADGDFTDSQAANAADLQFFFDRKGSFMAGFSEDGRTAAQIIADAATEHRINPWVVLATLEKEASLVSRQRQPGQATLRAAMGYAYNDSGSTAGRRSSFSYQIDRGTGLLRKLFDEGKSLGFPQKMRVNYGSRNLTIRNAATYALMRYTPHTTDTRLGRTGGGNYLFERSLVRFENEYARFHAEAQANPSDR